MSLHRIAPEERLALGIKHWRTIVRVALLLTAFPLLIPRALFSPLGTGLDNSWKLALQMAYERGFVAGSEFIFTYGPLGFLANRLPFDSTKSLLVCFDLFVALNVAILLRRIYVGSQSVWSCFFCLLIFALLSVAMYYMEPSGALFGLTQFFLFDLLCSGWWWALPLAVLNLVL